MWSSRERGRRGVAVAKSRYILVAQSTTASHAMLSKLAKLSVILPLTNKIQFVVRKLGL